MFLVFSWVEIFYIRVENCVEGFRELENYWKCCLYMGYRSINSFYLK